MKVFAVVLGLAGLALIGTVYLSRSEMRDYTESVMARVTRRTPEVAILEFDASIPGGRGHYSLDYAAASGTPLKAPPNAGELKKGERVELLYPKGRPGAARIPASLTPKVPKQLAWLGIFWVVMSAVILLVYRRPPDLPQD